jgi:2-C-methyl-D-erythritol 4-phosphate cytidylyltransferase
VSVRAAVVLPAAGGGRRFGGVLKPFVELAGEPVLLHALRPFLDDPRIHAAIVALPAEVMKSPPDWLLRLDARVVLVEGGAERGDSVRAALAAVPADIEVVLVHDAARPLVSADVVRRAIDAAGEGRSVVVAAPASDTVQQVDETGRIRATPDRSTLWLAQTPQAFPRDVLMAAYERAAQVGIRATDDAALVQAAGGIVEVIEGERENLKLTVPSDHIIAEALLRARRQTAP